MTPETIEAAHQLLANLRAVRELVRACEVDGGGYGLLYQYFDRPNAPRMTKAEATIDINIIHMAAQLQAQNLEEHLRSLGVEVPAE